MITKKDVSKIMMNTYKQDFDDTCMDILNDLSSIMMCACDSHVDLKEQPFLKKTLKAIGIAWAIYALRSKHSDRNRGRKVLGFLKIAKRLRKNGDRFRKLRKVEKLLLRKLGRPIHPSIKSRIRDKKWVQNKTAVLLVGLMMMVVVLLDRCESKVLDNYLDALRALEIDPIDQCIMGCNRCYDGDNLKDCANECLLYNGRVAKEWHICKYFAPTEDFM